MAASAGCRRGKDASNLNDEERARLRDQAHRWLRAEVAAWGKKIDSDPAAKRIGGERAQAVADRSRLGRAAQPDLLEKLPVAESRACREM